MTAKRSDQGVGRGSEQTLLRRKKPGASLFIQSSDSPQRDRDLRDMTVLWYGAAAWERNSKRDGQLLLARQDVFSGKG